MVLLGLTFKVFWFGAPRWLPTLLYVVMGRIALAAFVPLLEVFPPGGIVWLVGGGVWYTVGATAYAIQWPTIHPRHFTFHELFHVLVMTGSLSHFWFMLGFVLPAAH